MERKEKALAIEAIKARFDRMTSAVFLDFRGLTVASVTKLRNEFRKSGVEYRVVKNTLVKQALKDKAWVSTLKSALANMTGIAWSYDDPSAAAKVVKTFRKDKEHEKLKVKAGLIEGQVIDGAAVESQLATMPGKDELRAQLLATLQAPLQNFVALLQAPAQNLAYVLSAKERKDKGEGGAV
jgi:large subunit ribosomal protein L10